MAHDWQAAGSAAARNKRGKGGDVSLTIRQRIGEETGGGDVVMGEIDAGSRRLKMMATTLN
jgi:hypothetical protein